MSTSTSMLAVGPHRLEAKEYNPAGATPTLVFLHEGLGSVSLWRDFPARVAEAAGLRAFAYSRRGYGQSSGYPPPWPARYLHDEAALLPAVLAAAGIGDYVLVGHSDGASISLIHAASETLEHRSGYRTEPGWRGASSSRSDDDSTVLVDEEERRRAATPIDALATGGNLFGAPGLRGLILEAPHVFAELIGLAAIEKARDAYAGSSDFKSRLARHHRDPDNAFQGWNTGWLSPEFRAWNIEALLPAVRVPALVIQGEADEYGTVAHANSIRDRSGGRVEIALLPGCGHSPHRDKPAETLAAMQAFLASLRSRP